MIWNDSTLQVEPGGYGEVVEFLGREEIPTLSSSWQLRKLLFSASIIVGSFAQAISIAVLSSRSVFHAKVIPVQRHDPTSNQCLVRGVGFQPG